MKFQIILFILFSIMVYKLNGQIKFQPEDKNNLYWQPENKINYSHFQSESKENCDKNKEKYGFKMSANIQLEYAIDVPKSNLFKKKEKAIAYDKLYLAPIFCKNCSCILSEDSLELVVYQLLFDVAEMCSRDIRKELLETRKIMNVDNLNSVLFLTVKGKWEEKMLKIWGSIFKEVLIQKKEGAFQEWRKAVDENLKAKIDYSTQENDIKRLIFEKPIEEGYKIPKSIIGDFKGKD